MADKQSCPDHFPAHASQSPCQNQNRQRRNHGFDAVDDPCHKFPQTHKPSRYVQNHCHKQRRKCAQSQACRRIFPDGLRKGTPLKIAAHIRHSQYRTHDQRENRQHKIRHSALFHRIRRLHLRIVPPDGFTGFFHGTEVKIRDTQEKYHYNGQNRIQVVGNGSKKRIQPACLLHL